MSKTTELRKQAISTGEEFFTERGSVTTAHKLVYVGYGIDAQLIYEEVVTKFSVAEGVIVRDERTGKLFDREGNAYKYNFVR